MNIDINGLEAIEKRLDSQEKIAEIKRALGLSCAIVERAAKQTAPKKDGTLRRSITSDIQEEGGKLQGVIYTPLEYAPYVEYGTGIYAEKNGRETPWSWKDEKGEWHTTRGQEPQPFMRPALDDNREEILDKLREALKK